MEEYLMINKMNFNALRTSMLKRGDFKSEPTIGDDVYFINTPLAPITKSRQIKRLIELGCIKYKETLNINRYVRGHQLRNTKVYTLLIPADLWSWDGTGKAVRIKEKKPAKTFIDPSTGYEYSEYPYWYTGKDKHGRTAPTHHWKWVEHQRQLFKESGGTEGAMITELPICESNGQAIVIHHLNFNETDNRAENLYPFYGGHSDHQKFHKLVKYKHYDEAKELFPVPFNAYVDSNLGYI